MCVVTLTGQVRYQKSVNLHDLCGVAETRYEFKCRDVPWNVSTRGLDITKNHFHTSNQQRLIHQISNADLCYLTRTTTVATM